MSLTTHKYMFFSDKKNFSEVWKDRLNKLTGDKIIRVLGVWDLCDETWFDDAPMLIEFSSGVLSVNVSCEKYLAIGWNDILPSEKPVWFDEIQAPEIQGLQWEEDLEWREYDKVCKSFGCEVKRFSLIACKYGLTGICVHTKNGGKLTIEDVGDVIAGLYTEPQNVGLIRRIKKLKCSLTNKKRTCFAERKKEMKDPRLTNQMEYLYGKTLSFESFAASEQNDHEHCVFCWKKFLNGDAGYCDADKKHWVCAECYTDFKDKFEWK